MWEFGKGIWTWTETVAGTTVETGLRSWRHSDLPHKPWVSRSASRSGLPRQFYEICRWRRISGPPLGLPDMLAYFAHITPIGFQLAGSYPLLAQCSRFHALAYRRFAGRIGYRWEALVGSLAGDDPVTDGNELTGGSDDEQIIRLDAVS